MFEGPAAEDEVGKGKGVLGIGLTCVEEDCRDELTVLDSKGLL